MPTIHKIFVEPHYETEDQKPVPTGMIDVIVDFDEMGENFFAISIDPREASDFKDQLAKAIEFIAKDGS